MVQVGRPISLTVYAMQVDHTRLVISELVLGIVLGMLDKCMDIVSENLLNLICYLNKVKTRIKIIYNLTLSYIKLYTLRAPPHNKSGV